MVSFSSRSVYRGWEGGLHRSEGFAKNEVQSEPTGKLTLLVWIGSRWLVRLRALQFAALTTVVNTQQSDVINEIPQRTPKRGMNVQKDGTQPVKIASLSWWAV
jgi:hypothetical protein